MQKYIIEREFPGAGQLTPEQLRSISRHSCLILDQMGPKIQWIESYVTEDKIYCVYYAPDKEMIRTHAEKGAIPANRIEEVKTMISPVDGH